jgi:hypothetical protein
MFNTSPGTNTSEAGPFEDVSDVLQIVGAGSSSWQWDARISLQSLGITSPGMYTVNYTYSIPSANANGALRVQGRFDDSADFVAGLTSTTAGFPLNTDIGAGGAWTTGGFTLFVAPGFSAFSGTTLRLQPNAALTNDWQIASISVTPLQEYTPR